MLEKIIRICCFQQKILEIQVRTPEGIELFHVCEKHRNLEYFLKYKISEVKIE
jgi:hypothetical protein